MIKLVKLNEIMLGWNNKTILFLIIIDTDGESIEINLPAKEAIEEYGSYNVKFVTPNNRIAVIEAEI